MGLSSEAGCIPCFVLGLPPALPLPLPPRPLPLAKGALVSMSCDSFCLGSSCVGSPSPHRSSSAFARTCLAISRALRLPAGPCLNRSSTCDIECSLPSWINSASGPEGRGGRGTKRAREVSHSYTILKEKDGWHLRQSEKNESGYTYVTKNGSKWRVRLTPPLQPSPASPAPTAALTSTLLGRCSTASSRLYRSKTRLTQP